LKNLKAHLAVLTANIFFAMNPATVGYITKKWLPPFGLNVIRVSVTSLLLWSMMLFVRGNTAIKKEHYGRFFLCSLTGIVINQLFYIKGVSMTLGIHASLLILVTPLFITLAAAWLGKEPLTIIKISGLILGISGAVLLSLSREYVHTDAKQVLWGDIFIVVNAISYALYFVLVKPLMREYNPTHVIRWIFTIALFMVIPIGWNEFSVIEWRSFTWKEFAVLATIVLGATFFGYLFNLFGIARLGASVAGTYIYTQPVFASLIAVFILHETFTLQKIIAAVLIIGGVLMVGMKRSTTIQT
jgi:drug/metabolite transporter (DMT)-like permease